MQNLVFDEGYREFTINGDEKRVIRFNPSDIAIVKRLAEAKDKIMEAMNVEKDIELNEKGEPVENLDNARKIVSFIDDTIKEQINYIFDYDVADIVFGNQSPMANIKGMPLYMRFMNSVQPIIESAMAEEREKSNKRVAKYTKVVK